MPPLYGRDGSSFAGFAPPTDTFSSKSIVGVHHGESSMVIGYQVATFTPGQQSILLPNHQFFLGSQERCQH